MFSSNTDIRRTLGDFHIEGMILRYSRFVPKLYNWCKTLGFETGKIVPSRAFCSDESQGYPIILIAKHFGGTFSVFLAAHLIKISHRYLSSPILLDI